MFTNYLKLSLRSLFRHKRYSLITLSALTLGLVPVFLILLYLQNELSYDQYHLKAQRIYRVVQEWKGLFGREVQSPVYPSPTAAMMAEKMPGVLAVTRLHGSRWERAIKVGGKEYTGGNVVFADPQIFDIFTFELMEGNASTALSQPQSVIVSEGMAKKLFGGEEPLGKVLTMEGCPPLRVTGVLKTIPKESHFLVDFLAPFSLVDHSTNRAGTFKADSWGFSNCFVYFLVKEGTDVRELEKRFSESLKIYSSNDFLNQMKHHFQPLVDIHLHSHMQTELRANGDINLVYFYALIAIITLFIACISYINLATVRSVERAREVGVRKVCGAQRGALVGQFLAESFLLTLIACIVALCITELILPYFNSYVERDIAITSLANGQRILWLLAVVVLVALCSGSYPALVLSSFRPTVVLGSRIGIGKPARLKGVLVVAQCAFSILFVITGFVVYEQLQFCRRTDMGYNLDHIMVVPLDYEEARMNLEVMKAEIRRNPNVLSVSSVSYLANQSYTQRRMTVPGRSDGATIDMCYSNVDHDYLDLFGLKILEGRNFSVARPGDTRDAFILNETAVKSLGWEGSAIGRTFSEREGHKGTVIGVVKDYHLESMHEPIKPVYLYIDPTGQYLNLCIRISPENVQETISFVTSTFKHIVPNRAFTYRFYDSIFDEQYRRERKEGALLSIFAALSILIASLGLLGLASLTVEQRTKEIGIRKVLGASHWTITALLTQDYARWGLIGGIIGWPVAWLAAERWLQSFVFRIDVNWGLLVVSSIIQLALVLLVVGYQSFRASLSNPADSLRHE